MPNLLSWTLSFAFLGIYWNNHHHLLHATGRINGQVLWVNQHLRFWLCLVPFVANWLGQSDFATIPTALYGFVFLLAGVAYLVLQRALIVADGPNSKLPSAIGRDRKGKASLILHALAIPVAFIYTRLADVLYVVVALLWFVPDRRIENYRDHP